LAFLDDIHIFIWGNVASPKQKVFLRGKTGQETQDGFYLWELFRKVFCDLKNTNQEQPFRSAKKPKRRFKIFVNVKRK
jgi:hypothetical protein